MDAALALAHLDHPVAGHLVGLDPEEREHQRLLPLEDVHHLLDAGHLRPDDVVGQEDGERLLTDEVPGHEHGVAQPQRLLLVDVGDVHHVRDLAHHLQLLGLAPVLEVVLQLEGDVEVIDDGALVATGDDDDLVDPGGDRLLDSVLDDRLVDHGQHLLGLRLGGGKEASSQPGSREDRLPDRAHAVTISDSAGITKLPSAFRFLWGRLGALLQRALDPLDPRVVDDHPGRTRLAVGNP